jgi:hypothetical protein
VRHLISYLYNGPSAGEVDLVDTELLLAVAVTNAGVDVVVIEDGAELGVVVDTLATGSVNPAVGLENSGTAALGASLASFVDEAASSAGGPADLDLVLLALGGPVGVEAAALADGEEEVMVVAVLGDEGGFLSVLTLGLEGNVDCCRASGLRGRVGHADGEEILPEGAERHDELASVPVQGTVDGVVVLASLGRDSSGTMVGPALHVLAGGDTDGRVLDAKGRNGVVEVIGIGDLGDIGSLKDTCVRLYSSDAFAV